MRLLIIAAMFAVSLANAAHAEPTVLITGSNRGIGLELTRQYAERGWNVIATCRSPERADALQVLAKEHDNIAVEQLDVTRTDQADALAEAYAGKPIDVLIHNAGILGDPAKQNTNNMDLDIVRRVMEVNAYAPLDLSLRFADHVASSELKTIVAMSSGLGSSTLTARRGGFYGYRLSKAAVQMAMRALRADLKERGITVGIISPGMVETDLLRESGFPGRGIDVKKSVTGLLPIIDEIAAGKHDGQNINYDRQVIPF